MSYGKTAGPWVSLSFIIKEGVRKKVLSLVLAMAMMLSVMVVGAGAASLGDYTDNDKVSAEYAVAVDVASQLGILEGVGANKYNPQGNLTRAQLATMTYRIATADVDDVYTANFAGGAADAFTDTPADAWFAGYVGYAADAGYLKGVGDGLYKPNSYMTGYQALAAFLRAIGYNEPGQFTGADWTVQVAMIANEIGALEGIEGVDLNKAITREVAAQIIYNTLFSDLVDYTPAFGYQNAWGEGSLATDVFDIVTDKEGEIANVAPWGRLATQWFVAGEKDAAVTIMAKPVATFTEATTECDMSTAIGEDDNWSAERWLNGALETKGNNNVAIDPTVRTGNVAGTDQGTLTEVYAYENSAGDIAYEIVEIETWLGQCIDTTAAKYDKAGHLVAEATADFNVYYAATPTKVTLETADFAEDEYVLVNESKWPGEDGGFFLTPTAPVTTAELKSFNKTAEISVVGGTTYDWAAKYFLGNTGSVGIEYNVFVDEYNNLIGLVKPADADPVYTILESGVKVTTGYDSHYEAEIVDLSDGTLDRITVDSYVNQNGDNQITNWKTDTDMTPYYEHNIVSYVEGDDGYELKDAADVWGNGGKLVNGEARIYIGGDVKAVADSETVYAVETECGEYDIYTGYANVPSIDKAGWVEVLLGDDNYADLVYIDATNAIYAGSEVYVYVMPDAADIGDGDGYDIVGDIVLNGEVTTLNFAPEFFANHQLSDIQAKGVTLKVDADGLVYDWANIVYEDYKVAQNNHNEVVYLSKADAPAQGYIVDTESVIWVVDTVNHDAEIGSADDFEQGVTVFAVLDDNTVEKAIVFKTIEQ